MATSTGHYGDNGSREVVHETLAWTFILTASFCTAALLIASTTLGWGIEIVPLESTPEIVGPVTNLTVAVALPVWAVGAFAGNYGLLPRFNR